MSDDKTEEITNTEVNREGKKANTEVNREDKTNGKAKLEVTPCDVAAATACKQAGDFNAKLLRAKQIVRKSNNGDSTVREAAELAIDALIQAFGAKDKPVDKKPRVFTKKPVPMPAPAGDVHKPKPALFGRPGGR